MTEINLDDIEINEEWSNVPRIEVKFESFLIEPQLPHFVPPESVIFEPIAFNQVITRINELITQLDESIIKKEDEDKKELNLIQRLIRHFFGPYELNTNLQEQYEQVMKLSRESFNNEVKLHIDMLISIYKYLTGKECTRYGPHWEKIGFQGTDPSTDLRGCGILSLILTLSLFNTNLSQLTVKIYKLSLDPLQNFPFCVMGINLISILLKLMRKKLLNHYFNTNEDKSLLELCSHVYASLYLELYLIWFNENKTIKDSGFVLRALEKKAFKSPKKLLNQLNFYLKGNKLMNNKSTKNLVEKEFVEFSTLD
jgi:ELMO domain-containing protein